MLKLSPPDPAWPPGLLDPPQTFDLSPLGSSRPGSGALRRRSSGGGPQGGGGGPSTSLEPGVEQEMPLGMQTSLERRKVNNFWDCTKKNICGKFFVFVKDIFCFNQQYFDSSIVRLHWFWKDFFPPRPTGDAALKNEFLSF